MCCKGSQVTFSGGLEHIVTVQANHSFMVGFGKTWLCTVHTDKYPVVTGDCEGQLVGDVLHNILADVKAEWSIYINEPFFSDWLLYLGCTQSGSPGVCLNLRFRDCENTLP